MLVRRNDGTEFGGSIYQKVNKKLETAVNLAWTAGNSNTRFGIAAKYQIDPDACFSVGTGGILLDCWSSLLWLDVFSLWKEFELSKTIIVTVLPMGARHCVEPIVGGVLYLICTQPIWGRCLFVF